MQYLAGEEKLPSCSVDFFTTPLTSRFTPLALKEFRSPFNGKKMSW